MSNQLTTGFKDLNESIQNLLKVSHYTEKTEYSVTFDENNETNSVLCCDLLIQISCVKD